jgi:hypothetical protein
MKKIILTDADGVLCEWNKAFNDFMLGKGYTQVPGTDSDYSLANRYNIDIELAVKFAKEFNESDIIATLEPFADSVKYVKKLNELGFRFIVVTSISDTLSAKEYRTQNLTKIFGDIFDDIHCIETGASKDQVLKNWLGTGYFWIEDHTRQAEAGFEVGLKPILVNHPYNSHFKTDLFPSVSYTTPWEEIYHMICKEYSIDV